MGRKTKKSAKKFQKNQKKANLRNKARGKRTVSIRGVQKKKQPVQIDDFKASLEAELPEIETTKTKSFLGEFSKMDANTISVDEFLEADFSTDDDDDDEPMLEEPPTKKRKLNEPAEEVDKVAKHRADLEKLKELDPEFYTHLQENAGNLLDFGEEEEAELIEEGDPDPFEEEVEYHHIQKFTAADLKSLKIEVEKKPQRGFKKLVLAFQNATLLKTEESETTLHFEDSETFSEFMKYMIADIPSVMCKIVKIKPGGKITPKVLSSQEWHKFKPLCRMYLKSLSKFLNSSSEETSQQFVLSSMRLLIPFLNVLKADSVALVKLCVKLWAYGKSGVKKDAFLTLLEMCIQMHHDILGVTLKQMYLIFVKNIKKVQEDKTRGNSMDFMLTCLVEVYGVNPVISYQHGFVYIRELAIHLQKAVKNQQEASTASSKQKQGGKKRKKAKKVGKEAHLAVYNWRFLGSLKLFVKIVCQHVKSVNSELYPLVYPLVEILLALMNLHKGAVWFPFKLHVCELLVDIVTKCAIHIPVAPLLLEVLQWPGLRKKIKASTLAQLDIEFLLKFNELDLKTKAVHEACVENSCRMLLSYFHAYSCCVAFPELAFPIVVFLKKVEHDEKLHSKFRKQVGVIVKKLQENSAWIKEKRKASNLAPKDVKEINTFRDDLGSSPLHMYVYGTQGVELPETTPEALKKKKVESVEASFLESDSEDDNEEAVEPAPRIQQSGDVVEELVLSDDE